MNILENTKKLSSTLIRYLQEDAFTIREALKGSEDTSYLAEKLDTFLKSEADFVSKPYLELQPVYAPDDRPLTELDLDEDVAAAFAKYLLDDPDASAKKVHLYKHQSRSLQHVMEGKNLVVCTGTGSGKTECFMLPLLNAIVQERKTEREQDREHQPGVRAMLLYPMNALVNDQVHRLRTLIRFLPEDLRPTFGLFTGDLKSKDKEKEPQVLADLQRQFPAEIFECSLSEGVATEATDLPIKSQYTHRWQWNRRPADIMVTNYAMLERLLLLPERQNIFSSTWRFIVLDEAHSYTGSQGTEIAWLIRRLVQRVNAPHLQFIATSATLANGGTPEEEKKYVKDEFASRLFPAAADTFEVEMGEQASAVPIPDTPYEGDLIALVKADLFQKTVKLLGEKQANDEALKLVCFLENTLLNNTHVPTAGELFHVANHFPKIDSTKSILRANENIKNLVRFTLEFYNQGEEKWAEYLHNDLDPRGCVIEGRAIYNKGNRLNVKGEWELVENDRKVDMTCEAFRFLYELAQSAANDLEDDYQFEALKIELDKGFKRCLEDYVQTIRDKAKGIENSLSDYTARWRTELNFTAAESRIPQMLYKALANRNDSVKLRECLRRTAYCPWDKTAQEVYGDGVQRDDKLCALLEIGMMTRHPEGRHLPLFDVRYHQLVRGLGATEMAVEFPDGTPKSLTLHRTDASIWGEEGHFLFTLGACRDCGMPFLLAYSDVPDLQQDNHVLVRDRSSIYKYVHAFALSAGGAERQADFDHEPEQKDQSTLYLNLKTGQVFNAPGDGLTPVYWYRHADDRNPCFLKVCPNCGGDANIREGAAYGIITPYESSSDMTRLVLLNAFAGNAEEDMDPVVNAKPGRGRKVLAFADSRKAAAKGAYKFHNVFSRLFLNDEVVKCVREAQGLVVSTREQYERTRMDYGSWDNLTTAQQQALEQFYPEKILPPNLQNIAQLLLERAERYNYKYLLRFVDRMDPSKCLNDKDSACICVLRVLRDFARRGVLKSQRIKLEFRLDENDVSSNAFGNEFQKRIPELTGKILNRLWWTMAIILPNAWKATDVDAFPLRMHLYADQAGTLSGNVGDRPYGTKITSFPGGKNCNALLNGILGELTLSPSKDAKRQFLRDDVFHRLQDSITYRKPFQIDAGNQGFGFSLSYLKENLLLYPGEHIDDRTEETAVPLRIEEHTAQLTTSRGRVYQQAFAAGDINILSCSTTFEMGIDVGGVNRVFLQTIPAGTANYRQRAGRAGRRPGATAYILSFADSNLQEAHFFEHPEVLFNGVIQPPRIYLEKPTFRQRHLRATALACFLRWLVPQLQGDWWARAWTRTDRFFFGYRSGHEENDVFPVANAANPERPLVERLVNWFNDNRARDVCNQTLQGIHDTVGLDPDMVRKDLVFQFLGVHAGIIPYTLDGINRSNYLELCGPNILEPQENGQLRESENPLRQCVVSRLKFQLENLLGWNFQNEFFNGEQKHLMMTETIKIFGEMNIVPKYGFPVDVIYLNTKDNWHVNPNRDLALGLYEFAPGRTVYADKDIYESKGFKTYGHGGMCGREMGLHECGTCHLFFAAAGNCPECGRQLSLTNKVFSRPVEFWGGKADRESRTPYGNRQQMYCGGVRNSTASPDCRLVIGESDTQLMRYINAGNDGNGFAQNPRPEEAQKKQVLYHEVITNIAIWSIPTEAREKFPGDDDRYRQALRSAQYAIQKAAAEKLNVELRDIGVLVQRLQEQQHPQCDYSFVIYDNASGGGGAVLPLFDYRSPLIKAILERAKEICVSCDCGQYEETPSQNLVPTDLPTMRGWQQANAPEANSHRINVACSKCLKTFENRNIHGKLDRWDAARLLEYLLEKPEESTEMQQSEPTDVPIGNQPLALPRGFVPLQPEDELLTGVRCILKDGTCVTFDHVRHRREDIVGIEEE